ncbi:MAG: 2-phosphosulfolactate phosphatase [Microbacterium sp.]
MSDPFDQSRYQVRFEWAVDGLARLADSEVVVVVDVLRFSSTVVARLDAGETVPLDAAAHAVSLNGAAVAHAAAALDHAPLVVLGSLRNAAAVAAAALAEQHRRGARTSIAVIAAGELVSGADGAPLRVAVEDLLGAGAVIDALSTLGVDHTTRECGGPPASLPRPPRRRPPSAHRERIGQQLIERGLRDEVLAASEVDASASVPALRSGVFTAY